jgi:dTDP-4-amino-4,6-dideoxygalactose transaminase
LRLPTEIAGNRHVYHVYAVLTAQRQEFMESLSAQGVQTGIHYPTPVHLLPAYSDLNYSPGEFPVSECVAAQEVSLPMFPELSPAQIETVLETTMEFCKCGPVLRS